MDVADNWSWKVKIYNKVHTSKIKTTTHQVSANKYPNLAFTELLYRNFSLKITQSNLIIVLYTEFSISAK